MDASLLHRSASAGSTIKKIHEINPELSTDQIIQIMRQATRLQGKSSGEFHSIDVIDEALALRLAQESLPKTSSPSIS